MERALCSVRISSMKKRVLPAARKGRPRSEMAASYSAIMDAVYTLLQQKSVRDLTIEEVAKRASVGKPTLYKWWPTKATLVLAMLCERMAPNLEKPTILTAEESLRLRVRRLIDAFNGPFGKIVAGLIAESQSEPAIRQAFFDRWVSPRRTLPSPICSGARMQASCGQIRNLAWSTTQSLVRSITASYWARVLSPDDSAKNWSSKSSVGIAREMHGVDGDENAGFEIAFSMGAHSAFIRATH